jgi:hypothetical protein
MPGIVSRHQTAYGYYDESNIPFLGDRSPYFYRELTDNIVHKVVEGDTLQNLAYRYYQALSEGVNSAAQLWWVIADFQPEPIHDPTRSLTPGSYVVLPSLNTVQTEILTRGVV